MKMRRLLVALTVLTVVVYFLYIWQTRDKVVRVVYLGLETPGTRIELVEPNTNIVPSSCYLRLSTPRFISTLSSLEQLKGLVTILNSQQALHFVRFRTSRQFCYNWGGYGTPQEIINYWCSPQEFVDTGGFDTGAFKIEMPKSGTYGILSDRAYKGSKFTPPTVRKVPGGYEIVRWVCIYDGLEGTVVQQWQETVGPDGSYQRVVRKSMPPPRLPDTWWGIYGLM